MSGLLVWIIMLWLASGSDACVDGSPARARAAEQLRTAYWSTSTPKITISFSTEISCAPSWPL